MYTVPRGYTDHLRRHDEGNEEVGPAHSTLLIPRFLREWRLLAIDRGGSETAAPGPLPRRPDG